MLVQAAERGETIDVPSTTSFYVYDSADAGSGLRKVFGGPSEHQYCRFITPLVDGWGIAAGQLDPQKQPTGARAMFWFNPLTGQVGPTISRATWREGLLGSEVRFLAAALPGCGEDRQLS